MTSLNRTRTPTASRGTTGPGGPYPARAPSPIGDHRNHLPAEHGQRLQLPDIGHDAVHVRDPQLRHALELVEQARHLLTVGARVEPHHHGLLDVVVVPALPLAVLA